MISLGLLGKDIQHSKSAEIYRKLLQRDLDYHHFDCKTSDEIPSLAQLFSKIQGLSITSPYKNHFSNEVEIDEECEVLDAINTVGQFDGVFKATNTDYHAIKDIFSRYQATYNDLFVVVLGDGAMFRVTQVVLERSNIPYQAYSRKRTPDFFDLNVPEKIGKKTAQVIVINACSRQYVFKGKLSPDYLFWDYNYNFAPHLTEIPAQVKSYVDGLEMLELQAKYALKFWGIS